MDKVKVSPAAKYILSRPEDAKALASAIRESRQTGKRTVIKFTSNETAKKVLELKNNCIFKYSVK